MEYEKCRNVNICEVQRLEHIKCTDLGVMPKIFIQPKYRIVDRYNVLQLAATAVFSIRPFPKGNTVIAEVPPKVWEGAATCKRFSDRFGTPLGGQDTSMVY